MDEKASPKSYFSDREGARAFYMALTRAIGQRRDLVTSSFISPANVRRFKHGGNWSNPNAPQAFGGEMERHGFTAETSNQTLRENDLGAIARLIDTVADAMKRQFMEMFYRTTSDACDAVGNVVDGAASGSLAEAYLEIMEKIEFVADKNGQVRMPQIHTGADEADRLEALMRDPPAGFREKLAALQARKATLALAKEVERQARFVAYGELG